MTVMRKLPWYLVAVLLFPFQILRAETPVAGKASDRETDAQTPSGLTQSPQWDVAFHPVIWDHNYKLGLGLSGGMRYRLTDLDELGGEAILTYFRDRIDGYEPVTEWGGRAYALRSIPLDAPFLFKLGAYLGGQRLEEKHWYFNVGGVVEASFSFVSPWGLYLQFSPGYLIGENSQGVFRLGIGTTYNFDGKNSRAPKPKLQPPEPEPAMGKSETSDFSGTMVHLPEPESTPLPADDVPPPIEPQP